MNQDNIPIHDKARDKAWQAFIKRKDVKAYFGDKDEAFKFPLERGWYELWCQCWEKAWQQGWDDAQKKGQWVGLTDEERSELWWNTDMNGMPEHDYGKAVEAKLKERNT